MNTELVILSHLIFDEDYSRKVLPFIKPEYFKNKAYKTIYVLVHEFVEKFNAFPTKEALLIDLSNKKGINEQLFKETKEVIIDDIKAEESTNQEWLIGKTEEFCKEMALHNAVLEAIKIIENEKPGQLSTGALPKIMEDALSVSFNSRIGHDYLEDAEKRYEYYQKVQKRIPFSIKMLNTITEGGLLPKTLNCFLAQTGGGKTRLMCHEAAHNLKNGYNVLYITLEMSEEEIGKRMDANLLDIPMSELKTYPKEMYDGKMARLRKACAGKLIVHEFPTAGAGVNHFRFLLNELRLKKNFEPNIIYIDYINICLSSRMKMSANVNSYERIKAIAEEFRGLGVEFNVPIVTATQITRSGFNSSDIEMENTSESIALPATCDLLIGIINTEELDALNQIMIKQLKNRYGDPTINRRFCVGLDRSKMRLVDLDDPTADLVDEDTPVMEKTTFGRRDREERKRSYEGFKFT